MNNLVETIVANMFSKEFGVSEKRVSVISDYNILLVNLSIVDFYDTDFLAHDVKIKLKEIKYWNGLRVICYD